MEVELLCVKHDIALSDNMSPQSQICKNESQLVKYVKVSKINEIENDHCGNLKKSSFGAQYCTHVTPPPMHVASSAVRLGVSDNQLNETFKELTTQTG